MDIYPLILDITEPDPTDLDNHPTVLDINES